MLDARHHFVRIHGKTPDETSSCGKVRRDAKPSYRGFRGMALIDPRVQTVMHNRLQRYGFVNSSFHPKSLQPFSAVVINGGMLHTAVIRYMCLRNSGLVSCDYINHFGPKIKGLFEQSEKKMSVIMSQFFEMK